MELGRFGKGTLVSVDGWLLCLLYTMATGWHESEPDLNKQINELHMLILKRLEKHASFS